MKYAALHNRFLGIVFIIFFIFLTVTFLAWKITSDVVLQETRNRFYQDTLNIKNWVQVKLNLYISTLEGLRGFLEASDEVRRDEWSTYIKRINLIAKYPGLSSISYIERVTKENKNAFIESVRNDTSLNPEGYPDFNIYPDEEKEEYFVIKYIEPLEGREKALGFDVSSDSKRLQALESARDSGKAATTGRVVLVTTDAPGFGLLDPVYNSRMEIKGFVYAISREDEMFKATYGKTDPFPEVDFEIYDSENLSDENLLYDHDPSRKISDARVKSKFTTRETLDLENQKWVILIATKEQFGLTRSQSMLPAIVLISGISFSLIFLGVFLYKFRHHLLTH